jgi:hypothetical protein
MWSTPLTSYPSKVYVPIDNVARGYWSRGSIQAGKAFIFIHARNANIISSITSHKEHDSSRLQGELEYLSQDLIGPVPRNIVVKANQQTKDI